METRQYKATKPPNEEAVRRCPYCREFNTIQPAKDYAPVYDYCAACGRRFILERTRTGIDVMRLEDASCASDPECRVIEMSQSDEE